MKSSKTLACSIAIILCISPIVGGVARAQAKKNSSGDHSCPGDVHGGAYDKPGPDALKAIGAYDSLTGLLGSYQVQDRVLAVAIDLAAKPAKLDLVADNVADVPFVAKSVPNPFEDVPTEVTLAKPYERFLPYMMQMRGLSRAPEPDYPPGCPRFASKDRNTRADLDVVRAMAARIDVLQDVGYLVSGAQVDGVGIDLQGPIAKLDVDVDDATQIDAVRALLPETFEGVPIEVYETAKGDNGTQAYSFGSYPAEGGWGPQPESGPGPDR
jgi:hypothetical protein